MPKIKVGIIGLGVGLKHYEAYKHSNLSQVKAIMTMIKKFEKKKENRNIKYFQFKDLINKDIDLVSIASYDDDYNQILEVLKIKKIFCRKADMLKQTNYKGLKN